MLVFEFTGNLEPDSEVVVDSENMEVTINGEQAYGNFSGDFLDILPGTNSIIYSDGEAGRTVEISVRREDRHG